VGGTTPGIEELGPVDFLLVEFPTGRSTFSGGFMDELGRLTHEGLVRVLDLVVIQKAGDGSVEGFEVDDLGPVDPPEVEDEIAEVLGRRDVEDLAAAMAPGSVAGVVVWENLWAAPLGAAARDHGGRVIATGRIPVEAIAASLEAPWTAGE
jgi:hypothetical protein